MKIRLTKSLFYSLFLHSTIIALVVVLVWEVNRRPKPVSEKRCKIMLSQVCHCAPEAVEAKPPAVQKAQKPKSKKKAVEQVRVEKVPAPVIEEKVVSEPSEEVAVEAEVVALVEEEQPDAVDEAEMVAAVETTEPSTPVSVSTQETADAPQVAESSPEEVYLNAHLTEIMALLRKNLYYPRMARKRGIEGKVIVRFELMTNGEIKNIAIVEAERDILGRAAVTTIERLAGKFPLPSDRLVLNVPIMYQLN